MLDVPFVGNTERGVESIFNGFKFFLAYYYFFVQQQVKTLTVLDNKKTMHHHHKYTKFFYVETQTGENH